MLQRVFVADLVPATPPRSPGSRRADAVADRHRLPVLVRRARAGCSSTSATWPSTCIGAGHDVSVLAPADDDTPLPSYVERGGPRRAGEVQRLGRAAAFGPVSRGAGAAVARATGGFDVLHMHEPVSPSLSLLALLGGDRPDRRDVPHRQPALAGDAGGVPDPAAQPGEDLAPGSRSPRTPAAPSSSTSAGTRSSSRTACTSTGSRRRRPGRSGRGRPSGRPWRSSAGSTSRARACRCWRRRSRPCWPPGPGTRFLVLGRGDGEEALEGLAAGSARGGRVPRAARRRGQGRAAALGRRLRRAAHRRRELRDRARRGDERRGAGASPATSGRSGGCWTTARWACCSRPATRRRSRRPLLRPAGDPADGRGSSAAASGAVRRYDWDRVARPGAGRLRDGAPGRRPGRRGRGVAPAAHPLAGVRRGRPRRGGAGAARAPARPRLVPVVLGRAPRPAAPPGGDDACRARRAARAAGGRRRRGRTPARPGHRPPGRGRRRARARRRGGSHGMAGGRRAGRGGGERPDPGAARGVR